MRARFDDLLREATLFTVALGIALGWAIYQVAVGVASVVDGLLTTYPSISYAAVKGQALTWEVGHQHLLTLERLVMALIQLAVILLVAALVALRRARIEPFPAPKRWP